MMAKTLEISMPPPSPWSARTTMTYSMLWAKPPAMDASMKITMPTMKKGLRP